MVDALTKGVFMTKQERLENANKFIAVIASCGREFFKHKGFISTTAESVFECQ